jgi:3-dehydroquinate synthase
MRRAAQQAIEIRSSLGSYSVSFDKFTALTMETGPSVLIVDDYFKNFPQFSTANVVWLAATETNKTLASVERIINDLRELGTTKRHEIVAVGGGIVQDVSTLASSLYMRGVDWHYVPTTLLGMVDSCIGGKSSINTITTKNLIGNIYPPKSVLIDCSLVSSLPKRDVYSGLAEALKIAYCGGEQSFRQMLRLLNDFKPDDLPEIVHLSLMTKKWFIEIDEFDVSERLQLNFGHTFGHAIESGSNFTIPHGLAVAAGMICAIRYVGTYGTGVGHTRDLESASSSLLRSGLSASESVSFDRVTFLNAFRSDKKHPPGAFRLVLPSQSTGVQLTEIERSETNEKRILEIVNSVVQEFTI